MTNVPTTMKLASDSDAIARRASAWGAVLSMALCVMVLIASEFMPVSLLTPLASDLRMTQGQAGQAISVSGIFAVLTSLFVSALTARLDRRTVLLSRASEPKELLIVPGAGHVDLYDRVSLIPWHKLQSFFGTHLAGIRPVN